ncbi:secretion protein EspA [Parashewanella tropica]|uniref:secretion protein EspA n=1 Tax=Parashewanella tropica TaxID=2547970 RepID=UPI001FE50741|nr:secretion protein EspA [Parashewanella tropica]
MGIEVMQPQIPVHHQLDPKQHYGALQGVQDLVAKRKSQKMSKAMDSIISDHIEQHTEQLQDVDGMDKWSVDEQLAQQGDSVLSGGIAVLYLFMNLLSELANDKYLQMQQKAKVSRDAQDKANEVNEKIADVSKQGDKGSAALPDDVINYMRDNGVHVDGKSIDEYLYGHFTDKFPNGKLNVSIRWSNGTMGHRVLTEKDGKWWWGPQSEANVTVSGSEVTWIDQGNHWHGNFFTDFKDSSGNSIASPKLDKGQLEAIKDALENVSNRASDFVSQAQLQLQKIMQTYNVTVSLINSMQTMLQEMNKSIAQNIR